MDDDMYAAMKTLAKGMERLAQLRDRMHLQMEVFHTAVENSGNHREGYFALRLLNNLAFTISMPKPAQTVQDAVDGMGEAVQQMENMCATIDTQIARFDAMLND